MGSYSLNKGPEREEEKQTYAHNMLQLGST